MTTTEQMPLNLDPEFSAWKVERLAWRLSYVAKSDGWPTATAPPAPTAIQIAS